MGNYGQLISEVPYFQTIPISQVRSDLTSVDQKKGNAANVAHSDSCVSATGLATFSPYQEKKKTSGSSAIQQPERFGTLGMIPAAQEQSIYSDKATRRDESIQIFVYITKPPLQVLQICIVFPRHMISCLGPNHEGSRSDFIRTLSA